MKKRATALAAVSGILFAIAMAAPAQAYWISPYLTKDVWSYNITGGCYHDAAGVGTKTMTAAMVDNTCYSVFGFQIGVRPVDVNGATTPITWGDSVARASTKAKIVKYKLYQNWPSP